jgi:HAD superfamily hydrolase (TIGR01509 family)
MISTVIFDLDGLLADTERLHRRAYQDVLQRFGVTLMEAKYTEHWIRLGRGITDFLQESRLDIDPDIIRVQKSARYRELVETSVQPMPGAMGILRRLRAHKILALASSSYPDAVDCVTRVLGIAEYFTTIVSRGNVKKVKPFPDIFLYAARVLAVEPSSCVVIEDAEKGVTAARAAGMKCIAVPNEYTLHNDFSQATQVVRSLDDITVELVNGL